MANFLSRLFKKAANQQASPFNLIWTGTGFSMIPYETTSYIRDGYCGNSVAYQIITALMEKFASIPFYIYEVSNEKSLSKYKASTRFGYKPSDIILKSQAMRDIATDNPIAELMAKPNTYQTEADFRKMCMLFLKTTGMAPVWANRGLTQGKPLSINCLPSQWVTLQADRTLMDAEKVWFSPMGGGVNELKREDVYLWKYINPDFDVSGQHLYGLSPLKAGLMDVKSSNEASRQMAKMYENGGARGIITPKENIFEKQINDLRLAIDSWITGSDNRGKVGGISVPVEFHNIGLDAVDMKLLEGKALTDERIAGIFNYPPALLKSDNKYDNINAAVKYVVTNSIYGDLVAYRDLWNTWLLPMFDRSGKYYVDFDLSVLPEMQEDMQKIVEQAVKMWWITPNEKRTLSKYEASEEQGMDSVFIPSGFTPISESMISDQVQVTGDYSNEQDK